LNAICGIHGPYFFRSNHIVSHSRCHWPMPWSGQCLNPISLTCNQVQKYCTASDLDIIFQALICSLWAVEKPPVKSRTR
jgi:hypothetical protein